MIHEPEKILATQLIYTYHDMGGYVWGQPLMGDRYRPQEVRVVSAGPEGLYVAESSYPGAVRHILFLAKAPQPRYYAGKEQEPTSDLELYWATLDEAKAVLKEWNASWVVEASNKQAAEKRKEERKKKADELRALRLLKRKGPEALAQELAERQRAERERQRRGY